MPQMAPMNWLILFMLFTLIFIFLNFLNYYLFIYKNMNFNKSLNFKKIMMNWKW